MRKPTRKRKTNWLRLPSGAHSSTHPIEEGAVFPYLPEPTEPRDAQTKETDHHFFGKLNAPGGNRKSATDFQRDLIDGKGEISSIVFIQPEGQDNNNRYIHTLWQILKRDCKP